jgi:hypothetical protein
VSADTALVPTAERVGKNEALFREVNERIRELNEVFDAANEAEPMDFVCECSLEGCRDYVPMTLAEYRDIREGPTRFLVAPGHVWSPEDEAAVTRRERYWIVEKDGVAAEEAVRLDAGGT